jgi:hypothetical protein
MRQVLTTSNGQPHAASVTQLSDISRLSAIATEIVAIRQHLADSDESRDRLDGVVAGLDATITALLHAAPVTGDGVATDDDIGSPPRRVARSGERVDVDQSVFLAWLADPALPDELAAGQGWAAEPVSHLLGRLSTSPRGLMADEAMVVGMPGGTSMGNAAVALVLAVEDPAGPRCRSYRAAVYCLRDLNEPFQRLPASARRFTHRASVRSAPAGTDA